MPNPYTDATDEGDWLAAAGAGPLENPFPAPGRGVPGILNIPGKMPCMSFGLPPVDSCPGFHYSTARDGRGLPKFPKATCWLCYAVKVSRFYPGVTSALEYHMHWALTHGVFAKYMIEEIGRVYGSKRRFDKRYFRLHWAGDMFSAEYCRDWITIVRAFPKIKFWVPTRAWVNRPILRELRKLAREPNVTVRPSALEFDDPPPRIAGLHAGSTAHLHKRRPAPVIDGVKRPMPLGPGEAAMSRLAFLCPATTGEGHECDTVRGTSGFRGGRWIRTKTACRACWDRRIPVSYRQH